MSRKYIENIEDIDLILHKQSILLLLDFIQKIISNGTVINVADRRFIVIK